MQYEKLTQTASKEFITHFPKKSFKAHPGWGASFNFWQQRTTETSTPHQKKVIDHKNSKTNSSMDMVQISSWYVQV
jgi:hypothetical protein